MLQRLQQLAGVADGSAAARQQLLVVVVVVAAALKKIAVLYWQEVHRLNSNPGVAASCWEEAGQEEQLQHAS